MNVLKVETVRTMRHLRVIQINDRAAENLQLYFDGLREDQVIYFHPVPGVTLEDAMRITGGRRLVLYAMDRPV